MNHLIMKKLLLICVLITGQLFSQDNYVESFLPEIFSQFPSVRDISISQNQDEIYFSAQSFFGELSTIVVIKKVKNKWSEPKITSFSGQFHDLEPFLSPDGLKLYFASNRPVSIDNSEPKDYDIWFVERSSKSAEWSVPKNIGAPINTEKNEFYPAVSSNGNLYFTSDWDSSKGKDDIFFSNFENGEYTTPISLSTGINSDGYEFNSFISPDENILVFSGYNRKDGKGSGDLYISFKDGVNWSIATNLSNFNSKHMDYCPFIDFQSNTIYFTSKRNDTKSHFKNKKSLDEFQKEFQKYSNGLSRIYKASFSFNMDE